MALTVTTVHTKTLLNPSTGTEDKVYGADYVSVSSHDSQVTGTLPASDVTGLATVATSGLSSDLTNDAGFITSVGAPVQSVAGKTGVVTLVAGDVGLGNVTNDAQTKAEIVPNTAPTNGQLLIGHTANGKYSVATLTAGSNVTITNAAGAITIAASGGSGGITWATKTTDYTAVSGDFILADTSSAGFTITLPATPSANDFVTIKSGYSCSPSKALTIARNGSEIMNLTENMTVNIPNIQFTLVYNATTGWTL